MSKVFSDWTKKALAISLEIDKERAKQFLKMVGHGDRWAYQTTGRKPMIVGRILHGLSYQGKKRSGL